MNRYELVNKTALKELVDKVSIYGDRKDFKNQVQLFSENALSETIVKGKVLLKLEGRKEMAQAFEAFEAFMRDYETAYHFNGQQIVTINEDTATGTCYCMITLIGEENGKKTKTTIDAIYKDDYIRVNNQWLIAKRVGHFKWQDKTEINS